MVHLFHVVEEKTQTPAEPGSKESWQELAGETIVAGNRLQENLVNSVPCQFYHADVTLLENASSWIVSCQNEHCLLGSTNDAFNKSEVITS